MSITDCQLDEKPSGLDNQSIFTVLSVTVLAFTAIQSHLTNHWLTLSSAPPLQWPHPMARSCSANLDSPVGVRSCKVIKSMTPHTHTSTPNIWWHDMGCITTRQAYQLRLMLWKLIVHFHTPKEGGFKRRCASEPFQVDLCRPPCRNLKAG